MLSPCGPAMILFVCLFEYQLYHITGKCEAQNTCKSAALSSKIFTTLTGRYRNCYCASFHDFAFAMTFPTGIADYITLTATSPTGGLHVEEPRID